jgi:hypothetical protein
VTIFGVFEVDEMVCERGVVERKSLIILFFATKISFVGVHGFYKIRGVSWWLFRISMLHKKPCMRFESQN